MANDSPGANRRRDRRLRRRGVRVRNRKPVPACGWGRRRARNARDRHDIVRRSVASAVVVERSVWSERIAVGRPLVSGQRVADPERLHRRTFRGCRGNAAVDTRADAAANGPADAPADAATDSPADSATHANALHLGCA
jgi:hypothetical protein